MCIVFIDEFDSLAMKRGMGGGSIDKEEAKVVNTLLAEMDNINRELNRDIIVIAATNDLNALDPAAIRPGRFNRRIEVPISESKDARIDVINKAMKYNFGPKGYKLAQPELVDRLASITPEKSAADLVGILEKATALAKREHRKELTFDDIMEGFQQQMFGYKSARRVPHEERRKTAWHEVNGHALVAWACGITTFLLSMQPRGKALGKVIIDPESISEFSPTKEQLLKRLLINVAGLAAEEVKYGDLGKSIGASQDFKESQKILRLMISTGLLGDSVAEWLLDGTHGKTTALRERHVKLFDIAFATAQHHAKKIIELVPPDILERMVTEALALNKELVGEEASSFFEKYFTKDILNGMKSIVEEYLKDPLVQELFNKEQILAKSEEIAEV